MTTQDNAAYVQSFNDAYNARDWAAAAALCTSDTEILIVATGQTFRGAGGVKEYLEGWATAFPDSRIETRRLIADEGGAVIEFTGKGTHTGAFATPMGDIPATGKHAEQLFCSIVEIVDGKLASQRVYFDVMSLLQQLGVAPGVEQHASV